MCPTVTWTLNENIKILEAFPSNYQGLLNCQSFLHLPVLHGLKKYLGKSGDKQFFKKLVESSHFVFICIRGALLFQRTTSTPFHPSFLNQTGQLCTYEPPSLTSPMLFLCFLPQRTGAPPKRLVSQPALISWMESCRHQPSSLKHLSRLSIRTALGHRRLHAIRDFDLPPPLKQYLMFEDLILTDKL